MKASVNTLFFYIFAWDSISAKLLLICVDQYTFNIKNPLVHLLISYGKGKVHICNFVYYVVNYVWGISALHHEVGTAHHKT